MAIRHETTLMSYHMASGYNKRHKQRAIGLLLQWGMIGYAWIFIDQERNQKTTFAVIANTCISNVRKSFLFCHLFYISR